MLTKEQNEIGYLRRALDDAEKTIKAERRMSAVYLLLLLLFAGALIAIAFYAAYTGGAL